MQRDYHGYTLEEALLDAEQLIAGIRGLRNTVDMKFIVGNGVIKSELTALLHRYGLNPTVQLGNSGVLVCIIE